MTSAIRKTRPADLREAKRRRGVWWLHPRVAALLGALLLVGAYLTREDTYLTLYGAEKYIDLNFLAIGLIIYAGFAVGSFFAVGMSPRSQEGDIVPYCRWVVGPLFGLTVFGYVVWFASALAQAGGPGSLLNIFYELLFEPDIATADYVRFEIFQRIPGITTLAQLGILYVTVEALLWVRGASVRRVALTRVSVILLLTLIRTIFVSERLSLIEVAVPAIVVLAGAARRRGAYRKLIDFAPFVLGLGVFGLFALGEYFRSWSHYKTIYGNSYLEFAVDRFMGYYAAAVNNAAVYYYYEPLHPLRHTLASLFEAPILGGLANSVYALIFGDDIEDGTALLEIYGNPEFNNVASIGQWLNEYSVFLAPVAAFLLGLLATSLYNSFLKGRLVGLLLYPSWFIGLLEISRVYYWPGGRYFPVLAFLFISLLLFKVAKVPDDKPLVRRQPRKIERVLEQ